MAYLFRALYGAVTYCIFRPTFIKNLDRVGPESRFIEVI